MDFLGFFCNVSSVPDPHIFVGWASYRPWIHFRELFSRASATCHAHCSTPQIIHLCNADIILSTQRSYLIFNCCNFQSGIELLLCWKVLMVLETTWRVAYIWHMPHSLSVLTPLQVSIRLQHLWNWQKFVLQAVTNSYSNYYRCSKRSYAQNDSERVRLSLTTCNYMEKTPFFIL